MEIITKQFQKLTVIELYEILKARSAVFVVEQNCVYQDLDDVDYRSLHIFCRNEPGNIIAYARVFMKQDEIDTVQMGRVLTTERGTGWGIKIVNAGIKAAQTDFAAKQIYIEAQKYAIGFYEKVGFQVTSEEFLEDGIPHVQMRWKINS